MLIWCLQASISIVYIVLHFVAALGNELIGIMRPPEIQIHGYCFIPARLGLVAWMVTLIVSAIVASKPTIYLTRSRECKLQILDLVCSSLALYVVRIRRNMEADSGAVSRPG